MNRAIFLEAQNAYEKKDYAKALKLFNTVSMDVNNPMKAGEHGLVYHQIGNCLVKLKDYNNAINAYTSSISDKSYISIGTVYYNLGMVYSSLNDFKNAVKNFKTAIDTSNYRSKYKSYTAMGNCLMKSGKPAEAAASFRSAALEENNPDPTRALSNLGVCFMALNRSDDAISVYESAFQFNMSKTLRNKLYANLGQAYAASGQMQKAVNSFENAIKDKTYSLSDSASVDYQRAIASLSKGSSSVDMSSIGTEAAKASGFAVDEHTMSDNRSEIVNNENQIDNSENSNMDGFNTNSYPTGPEQSSFVQVPDNQPNNEDAFTSWTNSTRDAAYNKEIRKSPGKIVLFIFLLLLAVSIIAGCVFYVLGFGFPTQEMIVSDFFSNPIAAKQNVFSENVDNNKVESFSAMIPTGATPNINGIDRSVNESTVYVSTKTQAGGDIQYKIKMTRSFVSWKIVSVDLAFASKVNN